VAAALVALGLLTPLAARGGPSHAYTAAAGPAAVKPSSTATYTIALRNDPGSPDRARQARIDIPRAFNLVSQQLTATTSAAGTCSAAVWIVESNSTNSRISARWPGDAANELCPGGVLTIVFRATAPATENLYTWATRLWRGSTTFSLHGSKPTVRVDGTPPDTAISSGPPSASSSTSATFSFTSTEERTSFACSIDNGAFVPCVSPQTYEGLGLGAHGFRVRATDPVGNTDPSPASFAWTVDTPAPTRVDSTPPGNVRNVAKSVRYRLLQLRWKSPSDADFDHVVVVVGRNPKRSPTTRVYFGAGTSYANSKFQNGTYYRYAIISYDHAGNASRGSAVVVRAGALLTSPRVGARLRRPPLLDWASVPRATYYNVQLYRGSKKVLSAWPARSSLRVKRTWWYQGASNRLKKGVYSWYVWPGFGRRSQTRYGQLLGQAAFVFTG
jgi:hypothetical protein